MPINELNVGDRVHLTSDAYTPSMINPRKDSIYGCIGTIEGIATYRVAIYNNGVIESYASKEKLYTVRWDNGTTNSYTHKNDLMPINTERNKCKSIW